MECCPKCGSISISWNGQFRCLVRACGHTWDEFPSGKLVYEQIRNPWLRHDLFNQHRRLTANDNNPLRQRSTRKADTL